MILKKVYGPPFSNLDLEANFQAVLTSLDLGHRAYRDNVLFVWLHTCPLTAPPSDGSQVYNNALILVLILLDKPQCPTSLIGEPARHGRAVVAPPTLLCCLRQFHHHKMGRIWALLILSTARKIVSTDGSWKDTCIKARVSLWVLRILTGRASDVTHMDSPALTQASTYCLLVLGPRETTSSSNFKLKIMSLISSEKPKPDRMWPFTKQSITYFSLQKIYMCSVENWETKISKNSKSIKKITHNHITER